MKQSNFRIKTVILIALVLLAVGADLVYLGDFELKFRTRKFNRVLKEKEEIMQECLDGMRPILARGEIHGSSSERNLFLKAEKNHITILEYIGNKLIYWSDNSFDVPAVLNDSLYSSPLIYLQNGWFLVKTLQAGNETLVGLLRLRSVYGFENDIIRNGFLPEFGVTPDTGFDRDENSSGFKVFASGGTFLFCLLYPEERSLSYLILIPLFLWGLAFMLLVHIILQLVRYFAERNRSITGLIICAVILALLYLLVLIARKPGVLFQLELFSPFRYTMNAVIPSLGHLLVFSVLLSVLSHVLFKYITENPGSISGRSPGFLGITSLLLPGALLFVLYQVIAGHLIFNSNISFETYKVLDLDLLTLAGFISIALLFSVPLLYLIKVFRILRPVRGTAVIASVIVSSLVFIAFFMTKPESLITIFLFYLVVATGSWILVRNKTGVFGKTLIFALFYGMYTLFLITWYSGKKTEENVKIQLITYSTENDPYAEHLLLDMWPQISRDSILMQMMNVEFFERSDVDRISDYLHMKYFTGYWGNFSLNIVLCRREDSLRIADRGEIYDDCFGFFENRIKTDGTQLTGTGFYFIDNKLGRSNYLGRVFFGYNNGRTIGLFIDLYNDVNVFQPGYSELLLDKKYHSYARLKEYSFAKYINGEIVLSTGGYSYNKTDAGYVSQTGEYRLFIENSFRHILYRNGNVTVLISWPVIPFQDIIISFAYLFAFIFIFTNLVLLLVRRSPFRLKAGLNFRQKLEMSFIGILLFSFTLISFVIASMTIRQYQTKHSENLKEKLNSIYMEMENKIGGERRLASSWSNPNYASLNDMLVRLSNIFNTDINLYDLQGYLIATSRPEIFYRNLTSHRMNDMARTNLIELSRSEYFQKEKIGNLNYISAYRPYYNNEGQLLTFLNLPYFRMQSVLAKEISDMIVAVINFTLLLIVIAMSLAVFISGRITAPLALLSSRLASVELGKKSEHLSYKGSDEVGDLVKQYNRMVNELDESAQKLARSERESAWREMAKQIAHEIKNPLTPMKLNVQQLLKSWRDGVPGFEKKLEKFTRNQIEYIENLSSIASAFSSFAKIPEPVPVQVDLVDQIKTTLELFKNTDNISFKIGWPHTTRVMIFADREHVNGIFSNLIKNSIQSIPPDKEGIVKVNLEAGTERVTVSVTDNGSGIPESLRNKMFTPNFTTKSSGAGLGLSIVKRYVESAGGRIWFESEEGKGSVFFVEFPRSESEGMQANAK